MKKLFISCPMRGRTEEAINKSMEKMHDIAEIVFDQELEDIDIYPYNPAFIPKHGNEDILRLGYAIQHMAQANYFIGVSSYNAYFTECEIENMVAFYHDIPATFVDMERLMPDATKIASKASGIKHMHMAKPCRE